MKNISIVLFNLGGPQSLEEVKPFLFNLFYDKAILPLPNPFRWIIAKIISTLREKKSIEIYKFLNGCSPILKYTELQRIALEKRLKNTDYAVQTIIAMRYSKPFSHEIMKLIENHKPEDIILLPLYPQFSEATTKSSIDDFLANLSTPLKSVRKRIVCCYPIEQHFINAHTNLLKNFLSNHSSQNLKLIISAHGLPKRMIDQGDPYVWQVEATCNHIMKNFEGLDWELSFQSRVGPVEWTKPSTEDIIKKAALENKNVLILPVSFVSEHSETLVELDIQYKELAQKLKIKMFERLPTLSLEKDFIESLAVLCEEVLTKKQINPIEIYSATKYRICPETYCKCINKNDAN